jgi:peptide/nickel transport system substrate-binding protein
MQPKKRELLYMSRMWHHRFLGQFINIAVAISLQACRCGEADRGKVSSSAESPSASPSGSQSKELPRQESLYIGGIQWGEPTSFNPLNDSASAWPCRTAIKILYETLFEFDPFTGKLLPLLGQSYQVLDQGIEVVLQDAARWNDGRPVSAWDVKFSYDLGKSNKAAPISAVWDFLEEVRVLDAAGATLATPPMPPEAPLTGDYPKKLLFVFKAENKNALRILTSLQQDFILPRHVFEKELLAAGGDFQKLVTLKMDKDPVGSGPYKLHSYSAEKIVTERHDQYWGNGPLYQGQKAVPRYLVHQMYNSNDQYSVALQQGRLDIASAFIPRIWLKEKEQVYPWMRKPPYFEGASIPMLFINVKKPVLNQAKFRRAMALAINYADIRELAVSGYSQEIRSGAIIPTGVEAKYFNEEDVKKLGATVFDPTKSKELLAEMGIRGVFEPNGQLKETVDASGQRIPTIEISSPSGWTDWEAVVKVVVKSLRDVGIDARERFVDANLFWSMQPKGEFDLLMWTPVSETSPALPWSRFEFMMSSKGIAPIGEKMWRNYGRFNDPQDSQYVKRVDELLVEIPKLTDETQLSQAYYELNRLFMELQPTLPLVYRPEQFYQYSTAVWTNFPTAENPYAPSFIPSYRGGTKTLWHLKRVSDK